MSELKIDEEHIQRMADNFKHIITHLEAQHEYLKNPSNDIFERYMTYQKIIAVHDSILFGLQFSRKFLAHGFNMNNSILKTSTAYEAGWTEKSVDKNPFFIQEGSGGISPSDIANFLKELAELTKEKRENAH